MEFEKIGTTSLTDTIYKSLLGKILSGEWKPGDWFPAERDIAEQMGVSRSSLHHAVLQLERDGFVYVLPRRGTQVADYRKKPTPQSLSAIMTYGSEELDEPLFHDLMDIRRWVEVESARRACTNIYESTLREMREIANRLAAENVEPVLMVLITRHYSLQAVDLQEAAAMHKELLDHIEAKDEDAAANCVERILAQGVNVLERKYKQDK